MTGFNYPGTAAQEQTVTREPDSAGATAVTEDIECDECGGLGRYDDAAEIICEDCGLVLSENPGMVPQDYSGSRGFESEESRDRYSELERSERATRGSTELL